MGSKNERKFQDFVKSTSDNAKAVWLYGNLIYMCESI